MENIEQHVKKVRMYNSDTKEFEIWYFGKCNHCGASVSKDDGECPEYKCWIA